MRQSLPIVGGYYKDADLHWSAQDAINRLPVNAERGGTLTPAQMRDCPGLRPLVSITTQNMVVDDPPEEGPIVTYSPVRGMRTVEGKLFPVAGTQLFQISNDLVCIPRQTIPGVGRVTQSHIQNGNGEQLVTANGSAGYVFHTALKTAQKITDDAFPGASIVFDVDGYIGAVEQFGRYWGHSDLGDATLWNTLDRAEAEADPDKIVTGYVSHREVLIFGRDTIEPFINTGEATGTFQRASNTVIECGCAAKFSVAGMDNTVFWLDDKRIVRRLNGYTPERVSVAAIEQALSECTASQIATAFAFVWEDRGHKVYYLTVPNVVTFGFDLLSGEWHRRKSPGREDWRVTALTFWNDQWVAGDRDGNLFVLDWDYHFDGLDEMERYRTSGTLSDVGNIIVNEVELQYGVGGPVCVVGSFPEQPIGPGYEGLTVTLTQNDPASEDLAVAVAGDDDSLAYTLVEGTLPTGLALSSAGLLTGTPTVVTAGTDITVRATDGNGLWADAEWTIVVEAE